MAKITTIITPALVRRYVVAGQVYSVGRRYVRVVRVNVDPPSITAHRCNADGEILSGRHTSGPLAGERFSSFTIYLTWRDGGWRLPARYNQEH